jgi:hypothetical protein
LWQPPPTRSRLSLGDQVRRLKDAAVVLDALTDTTRGDAIDPATFPLRRTP